MALTAYYSAGTATLTNGSAAVVGIGTAWTTNNLAPGDQIESDAGERATILTIDSPTGLTLDKPFAGTAQAAAPYKIWRTFDAQYLMEGARAAFNLLGAGSVAALAELDGVADKGMYFTAPNVLALFALSPAGRALLDDPDFASMRETLGLGGLDHVREVLTGTRTYYVGYNMGAVAISIASPAVVTKNAHGLVADSRISFSILPNTKTATISVGAPAVVTMANAFAAGQPIVFQSTGALPKGVVAGTTYYVIATGLSGASFQFSAAPGGAAINTSAPTVTISQASPGVVTEAGHGRAVGDAIRFATTGALPTGLSVGTTYFVKTVLDANTYSVSATPEGAAINTTSAGAGTHTTVQFGTHYLSETGILPTGITEGQEYYVLATGLTANTFQFSATSGGAAVVTTGSTSGTIAARTGSDTNDGRTYSAAGAFLTVQKAVDTAASLDLSIYNVEILVDSGVYGGAIPKNTVGSGTIYIRGKNLDLFSTTLTAVAGSTISACFNGFDGFFAKYKCEYLTMSAPGVGAYGIYANSGTVFFGNINFKAAGSVHVGIGASGFAQATEDYMISGGAPGAHINATDGGQIRVQARTITIVGLPTMPFANTSRVGTILANGNTFNGLTKGSRYAVTLNGVLYTGSGSATYFPGSLAGASSTGGQYA